MKNPYGNCSFHFITEILRLLYVFWAQFYPIFISFTWKPGEITVSMIYKMSSPCLSAGLEVSTCIRSGQWVSGPKYALQLLIMWTINWDFSFYDTNTFTWWMVKIP